MSQDDPPPGHYHSVGPHAARPTTSGAGACSSATHDPTPASVPCIAFLGGRGPTCCTVHVAPWLTAVPMPIISRSVREDCCTAHEHRRGHGQFHGLSRYTAADPRAKAIARHALVSLIRSVRCVASEILCRPCTVRHAGSPCTQPRVPPDLCRHPQVDGAPVHNPRADRQLFRGENSATQHTSECTAACSPHRVLTNPDRHSTRVPSCWRFSTGLKKSCVVQALPISTSTSPFTQSTHVIRMRAPPPEIPCSCRPPRSHGIE